MSSLSPDYEIYERKMILKGYGWPQFSADPIGNSTLSQESGFPRITIGDVGYTKKGRFHRRINILRDVFPNFSNSQICWENKAFRWPITGGSAKIDGGTLTTDSVETSTGCGGGRWGLRFEDGDGAILNLESGRAVYGYLSDPDSELLGNNMLLNYKSWLSRRDFCGLKPSQLVLVTGVYMTRNWEAATFQSSPTSRFANCSVYRHNQKSLSIDWSNWTATNHGYNTGHNHQDPDFQPHDLIPPRGVEIRSPPDIVRTEIFTVGGDDEDDDGIQTLVPSNNDDPDETIPGSSLQTLPATRSFGQCCRSCGRAPLNQCIFLQGWRIKEPPRERPCLKSLSEILELKETNRTKHIFKLFGPQSRSHNPQSRSPRNLGSPGSASEGIDVTEAELEELGALVDGEPAEPKLEIYDVVAMLLANEEYQNSREEPEIIMVHDNDVIKFLETYSEELGIPKPSMELERQGSSISRLQTQNQLQTYSAARSSGKAQASIDTEPLSDPDPAYEPTWQWSRPTSSNFTMTKLGEQKHSGPGLDAQNSSSIFNPNASDNLIRYSLHTTPAGRNLNSPSVVGTVQTDASQRYDNFPPTFPYSFEESRKSLVKVDGWNAFKLALNTLKESTSAFPSLQNAVGKLLKALDTIQEALDIEDQFTSMAECLTALSTKFKLLEVREDDHIIKNRLELMTRSVERRVEFIEERMRHGNLQRILDTSIDAKEIINSLREMAFVVPLFDGDTTMNTETLTKEVKRGRSAAHNDVSTRTWKKDGFEAMGNEDILSSQIGSFGDNMSVFKILDKLWARLRPLNSCANATWQSEMRDWGEYITIGTYVDSGAFGDVYTGTWINVPGLKDLALPDVVVKIVRPNTRHLLNQKLGKEDNKRVRRELEVWMKLRHLNIVPFIGVAYNEWSSITCPMMISLRMENGNLKRYLSQNRTCDKETFPLQIARGLAYLHHFEPEIVHGDLKAENILVDGDGILKLGGFGLSRMLSDEPLWDTEGERGDGSVRWMSPELLGGFQTTSTKESDIYAFGMTVFEIFSNQIPFAQYVNDAQVVLAVLLKKELPIRPHSIKDLIWDIINECWYYEPSRRLKIEEIIKRLEGGSQSDIPS